MPAWLLEGVEELRTSVPFTKTWFAQQDELIARAFEECRGDKSEAGFERFLDWSTALIKPWLEP